MKKQENPVGTRQTVHHLTKQRRVAAAMRQSARARRTDEEQLERLQARGAGHCNEALKLQRRIDKRNRKASTLVMKGKHRANGPAQ